MPTPEQRREVIRVTGLCLNENCTAHDGIIDRILELVDFAAKKAVELTLKNRAVG
jgi:hypothetical protein